MGNRPAGIHGHGRDFNNDGWPDTAIADHTWPNFLFPNNHDGTFKDVSLFSGLAASEDGLNSALYNRNQDL